MFKFGGNLNSNEKGHILDGIISSTVGLVSLVYRISKLLYKHHFQVLKD